MQETFGVLAFRIRRNHDQEKLQLVFGKLIRAVCVRRSLAPCVTRRPKCAPLSVCVRERQKQQETGTRFCARIKTTDSIRQKHNWTPREELGHEKFKKKKKTEHDYGYSTLQAKTNVKEARLKKETQSFRRGKYAQACYIK